MNIDQFSPATIGEEKFVLSVGANSLLQVFGIVQIDVDYTQAFPEGPVLPLEFVIQGQAPNSYISRIFRKAPPRSITFTPIASGEHLVLLREVAHNRWIGKLRIQVTGDPFAKV